MMRREELRLLLEHAEWADAMLWNAVRATPGAAADARLRALLHHMLEAQAAYLEIWRGGEPTARSAAEFADLPALEGWGREVHGATARFMAAAQDWGGAVQVPWEAMLAERLGRVHPASLGDTVLQVAGHGAYHRGQVNARIRELGGEPALVDYIIWVWAGRPPAPWPELSTATNP